MQIKKSSELHESGFMINNYANKKIPTYGHRSGLVSTLMKTTKICVDEEVQELISAL
jgi:hypothetical protein